MPLICTTGVILLMHSMSVVTNEAALPLKLNQQPKGNIYIYNPTGHHSDVEQKLRQYIEDNGHNALTLTLRGNNVQDGEYSVNFCKQLLSFQ